MVNNAVLGECEMNISGFAVAYRSSPVIIQKVMVNYAFLSTSSSPLLGVLFGDVAKRDSDIDSTKHQIKSFPIGGVFKGII